MDEIDVKRLQMELSKLKREKNEKLKVADIDAFYL